MQRCGQNLASHRSPYGVVQRVFATYPRRQIDLISTCRRVTRFTRLFAILVGWSALAACSTGGVAAPPTPPEPHDAEIVLYNWVDYLPQSVIDDFTAETGIAVTYVVYEDQDEAVAALRAGTPYDLVVLTLEFVPQLIADGLLAEIDAHNVPNLRNVSANFRDLAFDPGNRYTIPYHWGTTGLLVRSDLVAPPPTRWADMWEPRFAGKVAIWPLEVSLMPIALKALGYSANAEDQAAIDAALQWLLDLKAQSIVVGNENATILPVLTSGEVVLAYGWAYDAQLATEEGAPFQYILREEGSILWSDYFVLPRSGRNKRGAELFLDFLLRPEISARIVAESFYPMANDAALPLIDPEILANPVIYPPPEALQHAELTLPLSPDGTERRRAAWQIFLDAPAQP